MVISLVSFTGVPQVPERKSLSSSLSSRESNYHKSRSIRRSPLAGRFRNEKVMMKSDGILWRSPGITYELCSNRARDNFRNFMYQYWRIGIETFIAKPFLSEPYILWQAMSLFFEQILAYFIGFEKKPKIGTFLSTFNNILCSRNIKPARRDHLTVRGGLSAPGR